MKQLLFRLSEELKNDIEQTAGRFDVSNSEIIRESIAAFIASIKGGDAHYLIKSELIEYQFLKEVVRQIAEKIDISDVDANIPAIRIGYFNGICNMLREAQANNSEYAEVLNICLSKIAFIKKKMDILGINDFQTNSFESCEIDLSNIADHLRRLRDAKCEY
jgi:hypothetical protein